MKVEIKKSSRRDKKLMAIFSISGKRVKTTHFGGRGCMDYTKYWKQDPSLAKKKREQYIKRHRVNESWRDPAAAGTLSRYILWEKPTVDQAIRKFKVMFRLD